MARVVRTSPWDSLMNNMPALAMEWYKTQVNESEKQKERDHDIEVQGLRNESNETTTRMGITGRQALLDDEQLEASGIRQKELDRIKKIDDWETISSGIFNERLDAADDISTQFFDKEEFKDTGGVNTGYFNQELESYPKMYTGHFDALTDAGVPNANKYLDAKFSGEIYNQIGVARDKNLLRGLMAEYKDEFPDVPIGELSRYVQSQLGEQRSGAFGGGEFGGLMGASKFTPGSGLEELLEFMNTTGRPGRRIKGEDGLVEKVGGRYFPAGNPWTLLNKLIEEEE